MLNIVSFSLYGTNPLYTLGAIENARLSLIAYPGWRVVVFADKTVPSGVLDSLRLFDAVVIPVEAGYSDEREAIAKCALWRFLVIAQPEADYVIFRDCDSRVSEREAACVRDWMALGSDFHLMFDHPYHAPPILAGMWGCRACALPHLTSDIQTYVKNNDSQFRMYRNYDQRFLKDVVWERYIKNGTYLAHGEADICKSHLDFGIQLSPFPTGKRFFLSGTHRQEFVGETIWCPYARKKPERFPKGENVSTADNQSESRK